VTLIFVGRERLGIGSGLVQIIAPDVGTVMGVLDGEQYEGKERVLSAGIHTFVQTSTDTASESFGRRPSIATSDRSSLIARLAAESDCAVLLSLLLTRVSFLTLTASTFDIRSRLMLIAPHPDDEALACSVILQQAVRAGAAIRIVYVTDGDNNPWPQRALERRWSLSPLDRKRWGKLRRAEALAALHVLGIRPANVQFLALPDQGLTDLLLGDCDRALTRITRAIDDWSPTDILAPSPLDIHPDHNAIAVMMRLIFADLLAPRISQWNYLVHGRSPAFFDRAAQVPSSELETATKREAIRCHQTQIKLSSRRFLRYAARPERFLRVERENAVRRDGAVYSVSRARDNLDVDLRFSADPFRLQRNKFFILGRDSLGRTRACQIRLPSRSADLEVLDCATNRSIGIARYRRRPFAGEFTLPLHLFSPLHDLFIKVDRRSWFFDEAGWIEIPSVPRLTKVALSMISAEAHSLAVR
jgi:LmbE family N-acetylglucosaminyl deacetylase